MSAEDNTKRWLKALEPPRYEEEELAMSGTINSFVAAAATKRARWEV